MQKDLAPRIICLYCVFERHKEELAIVVLLPLPRSGMEFANDDDDDNDYDDDDK